jgi:hypothetical protein
VLSNDGAALLLERKDSSDYSDLVSRFKLCLH